MPRTSDARERTLETAANLFRRQGYHGTPMSQILEESGAPRGSLYFHFPGGKEQIAAEAVAVASAEMMTLIERARDRSTTAVEFIGRVTGGIARWLEQSNYIEGCPIATVTLELVPSVDEVAQAVRTAFQRWTELIKDGLVGFGVAADRAEGVALLSVTAIEGGLLLSRADRSTVALRQVREQLMAIVASSS
ncbi:MAG TPA: TetR/AcrR family transcriptional regulator [Acidimicrobiia bacterium]|nr:TetR/AcrR family transcriptional regulator [Acidimicrobiia bacterium]